MIPAEVAGRLHELADEQAQLARRASAEGEGDVTAERGRNAAFLRHLAEGIDRDYEAQSIRRIAEGAPRT